MLACCHGLAFIVGLNAERDELLANLILGFTVDRVRNLRKRLPHVLQDHDELLRPHPPAARLGYHLAEYPCQLRISRVGMLQMGREDGAKPVDRSTGEA